jgi:hypothetical protein
MLEADTYLDGAIESQTAHGKDEDAVQSEGAGQRGEEFGQEVQRADRDHRDSKNERGESERQPPSHCGQRWNSRWSVGSEGLCGRETFALYTCCSRLSRHAKPHRSDSPHGELVAQSHPVTETRCHGEMKGAGLR